ncbi:hypothetical protein AAF712_004462 [Marasmius tenuissimus]|uniref:Uncharacterized protein n=1 Tax=Marasmius tenuissimus TaxID=585030 RepID=A0ABR3A4X1_9AGAR
MSTPRKSAFSSNKTDRFAGEALISPQLPSTSHTSPSNGRPTRKSVMTSVRRSLSVPRKSRSTSKKSLAEQTAEDQTYTSSRFRRHDPSLSPPTVEQIAMGLHLSRTPHLRGHAPNQFHNHPGGFPRSISLPLPPPPARSAMKKTHAPSGAAGMNPGLAAPSASSTTITSLSTPHSSNTANSVSLTSLKSRMTRLLISSKGSICHGSLDDCISKNKHVRPRRVPEKGCAVLRRPAADVERVRRRMIDDPPSVAHSGATPSAILIC